eukprot:TRINITY_DN6336_c0_g1_i1.p1 TRINITY_DN6336_c0_g1~~TRINITY_DN6336_c0_g1_i1.p1  ORF type:complete len:318 (+),score=63.98 TRINITY_DN6336_c0_g1_i1:111-956(+)
MDAYSIRFRLEEIQIALTALRNGTFLFKKTRSPSPEPVYDSQGKRINTRENRKRDQLLAEQRALTQQAFKINPTFKPPPGYQSNVKKTKKIYVPVKQYPDYNFIGQIIGPRGLTQKELEKTTGAKIAIRGKGSVLSGKERSTPAAEDDDLHVFITCDSEEQLVKATKRIEELLVPIPDGNNEHKRKQLELLAKLNGTHVGSSFLLNENLKRSNVTCAHCGEPSHPTLDCPQRKRSKPVLEAEYEIFMHEVLGTPVSNLSQPEPHLDEAYQAFLSQIGGGFN